MAQATMIPTAAIIMAPVTELFGSIASYNVLSIASPVLAALTSYLLCRRLARRELPALVGGYLFGFSSYEFAQLAAHLNLTLVFLIPVFVHITLRRIDREISRRVYVIGMALLIVLQAGLSTELLAECVGLGAVLFISAHFLTSGAQRKSIDGVTIETVGAGLIALIIASPFFYYAIFSGGFPSGGPMFSDQYALDLLNPLFPTYATWLGHHDFLSVSLAYSGGGVVGADGYLSVPLLIAFFLYLRRTRGQGTTARLLTVAAGVSFVAALGSHLYIDGDRTIALPFNLIRHLPVFNNIIPSRIFVFTTLAVAVGVSLWLTMPRSRRAAGPWLVVLLGIVLTLPNITSVLYGRPVRNPRFFATSIYRRYLTRGETVLVLPYSYNDQSMLWQAETGFYFYMPEGYVGQTVPSSFITQPTVDQLLANVPPNVSGLGAFIREHFVHDVVVDQAGSGPWSGKLAQLGLRSRQLDRALPWPEMLARLGLHDQRVGGVLVYTVPYAWHPSSATNAKA